MNKSRKKRSPAPSTDSGGIKDFLDTINILPSGISTWSNGYWRTSGIWGWMAILG